VSNKINKINSFQDLVVGQKAELMFDMITEDVKKFPDNRITKIIIDQLIRCIGSIELISLSLPHLFTFLLLA
jgi:hypothetical protein